MKKHLTFNITIEDGKVTEMESIMDGGSRTEFVADYEAPVSIEEAAKEIRNELKIQSK